MAGISMNRKSALTFLGVTTISCIVAATDQINSHLDPICNLLINDVNEDVEALIKRFGNPKEVNIEFYPNKHIDDATDEVHTAIIEDGLVAIYSVPAIERNYILRIEFTNDFWPEDLPKYIARSTNDIEHIFGTPDKSNESSLQYYCDIENNDYVQFMLEANRVVKLRAQKWID